MCRLLTRTSQWRVPKGTVEEEYDRAAARYDRRWNAYICSSIEECLRRVRKPYLASIPKDALVMDLGTGTGALAFALVEEFPDWNLVAVDASAEMLSQGRQKANQSDHIEWVRSSCDRLAFADSTFDLVATSSSFHFWGSGIDSAMGEIMRVLKPGGLLIVSDWCRDFQGCKVLSSFLRLRGYPEGDWRVWTLDDTETCLRKSGFDVVFSEKYTLKTVSLIGGRRSPKWAKWGMMTIVSRKPSIRTAPLSVFPLEDVNCWTSG